MSCKHFEELLTAYAEGEVTADEKRRVDDHVESCEACREALAFYVSLETSLLDRRSLPPSAARTAHRVVRAVGLRTRPAWVPALTSLPGVAALAMILFGVVGLFFGNPLSRLSGGSDDLHIGSRFNGVMEQWMRAADTVAAGNEYTLPIVMAGVTALFLLAGSLMVLRYVRD
jgi:anti-sigma factor RsiW